MDEDIQKAFCHQRDHLQRTVNSLQTRLAKSAEEHEKAYAKIMKVTSKTENTAWIIHLTVIRDSSVPVTKSEHSLMKK